MLNFQQQQEKDLDDVFFNVPAFEFVTTHRIAGIRGHKASPAVECNIVVDRELYTERRISSRAENVSLNGLIFFIKKSDWLDKFNYIPKVEAALQFDGERYTVEALTDNMGVLEFTLGAYRG